MKKAWKIIIGIVILVLVVFGAFIYYINSSLDIEDVPAVVYPDGSIELIRDGQSLVINSEYSLQKSDLIKTSDAKAKVVFYDSVFVFVEPNSEIGVDELAKNNIQLDQKSGSTWNKVTALFQAQSYSVKTPNSVASVRGTEFQIDVGDDPSDTIVTLVEGKVEIDNGETKLLLYDLGKASATKDSIKELEFTEEERQALIAKIRETKNALLTNRQDMANRLIEKNQDIISTAESTTGASINDDRAKQLFDDVDSGRTTFDEFRNDVEGTLPLVNTEFIDEFEAVTNEIEVQDKIINKVQNGR